MSEGIGRRIWASALTGIPFGIYKIGFGWYEYENGFQHLGVVAMIWGSIDVLINLAAIPAGKRLSWCLLSNIGRMIDRGDSRKVSEKILLAVDTTVSFLIVSLMIWFGRLPLEPPIMGAVWNLAVIGNVMAVGVEQLYRAVADRSSRV